MRVFRENIVNAENLIVIKEESFPYNEFPFHNHPEYEIIFIMESSGRRIVGDSITEFSAVDLCMFGSNLPHTFYTKGLSADKEAVKQVVIQFHENFLGPGFFERPTFAGIKDLFSRSARGIVFGDETIANLSVIIQKLVYKDPAGQIIGLLNILHALSQASDITLLSSPGFVNQINSSESTRMGNVYDYVLQNFKREISLDEVATIAYLSPAAFCRYFKKFTRKTLSEFILDLRIGYACKLLQSQSYPGISWVSAESGFNNISYFNRKFKVLKGETPMQYKRRFAMKKAW